MQVHRASQKIYQEHLRQNKWFLGFFERNVNSLVRKTGVWLKDKRIGICYFDEYGILLYRKIEKGLELPRLFEEGQHWTGEGKNAVIRGIRENTIASSVGSQNEHPLMEDYGIYFAPVNVYNVEGAGEKHFWGGVTLVVEKSEAQDALMAFSYALSQTLMINMAFNITATTLYQQLNADAGMLMVDTHMNTFPTITHFNDEFLELFHLPKINYSFQNLEQMFPQDKNEELYDIVLERKKITTKKLRLHSVGKTVSCEVSTVPFYQPEIPYMGVLLFVLNKRKENRKFGRRISDSGSMSFDDIIAGDPKMKAAIKKATLIANTDSNVLILGENGSGKDVFARAIHNSSPRKNQAFVAINCASIPRELIASELFGYEGGAFTGARREGKIGKFELADGGTVFLDEIGDLPLDLQSTLLRAIEQKKITRVGGTESISIDVRFISATNANLQMMILQKKFRIDLFYRLGVFVLNIPPLRNRGNDILLLAQYFIDRVAERIDTKKKPVLTEEARKTLLLYSWPGNVRELQNLIEAVVQLYPDQDISAEIVRENMNLAISGLKATGTSETENMPYTDVHENLPFQSDLSESRKSDSFTASDRTPASDDDDVVGRNFLNSVETYRRKKPTREQLVAALDKNLGNRSATAKMLGVARNTLYRYMKEYEID